MYNDIFARAFIWGGILLFLLCNTSYFFNYQKYTDAEKGFQAGQRVAMVYAAPTFHDEVVSSVACTLKDDGFFVVAYVGNGLHVGNVMVPLSGKRQRNSEAFYGACVDKWISITDPISASDIVPDPDLLVYVTYPMLKKNFVHDGEAIQLLRHVRDKKANTNIVLITHRANEALHETLPIIESIIPRNRITFTFLGEHTKMTTKGIMESKDHTTLLVDYTNTNNMKVTEDLQLGKGDYRLAHFYPIVPMEYIGQSRFKVEHYLYDYVATWTSKPLAETSKDGWPLKSFSIQGNFGGKHAHRKDVKGTIECLKRIENTYLEDDKISEMTKSPHEELDKGKTPIRVNLELIGHLTEEMKLPTLAHGTVRFLSDLAAVDYYRAIARTQFMIGAVGEEDYYTGRATSSVPAALIANVPLVVNKRFLDIYPCLRDAKVHQQIAHENTCEAIYRATKLTSEEYLEAKKEIARCAVDMYDNGKQLFKFLGEEARTRRSQNKLTGAAAIKH
jgi:hypothetical protein